MALVLFTNTFMLANSSYLADSASWNAATVSDQEKALLYATEKLDNKEWAGYALTTSQPLSWPRTAFDFWDPVLRLYVPVAESELPVRFNKAMAKIAIHYIENPEVASNYSATYDKIKVGPIELENTSSDGSKNSAPEIPYNSIEGLIRPLLANPYTTGRAWWRAN
jgi:hypothetical protein